MVSASLNLVVIVALNKERKLYYYLYKDFSPVPGVRVRGHMAGWVGAAQDSVRLWAQLHLQDVLLPVHQLLLSPCIHCFYKGNCWIRIHEIHNAISDKEASLNILEILASVLEDDTLTYQDLPLTIVTPLAASLSSPSSWWSSWLASSSPIISSSSSFRNHMSISSPCFIIFSFAGRLSTSGKCISTTTPWIPMLSRT